jgi:hypothetical protein
MSTFGFTMCVECAGSGLLLSTHEKKRLILEFLKERTKGRKLTTFALEHDADLYQRCKCCKGTGWMLTNSKNLTGNIVPNSL